MQKLREKLNAKSVGAGLVPAQNKGITLIALIITIIVMLILVGVTINVVLNGGLFEKAEYASEQMQIEAEKEELLSAVVAAIGTDGKVSIPYLDDNLPEGWSGSGGTYLSPKENTYTVDANGKITYIGKIEENKPNEFDWGSVELIVDTSTEYESADLGAIVTFSIHGKLLVKADGVELFTIDATDENNIVNGEINYSTEIDGTLTNVIVKMNENNTDIDVTIEGLGTITFVKIEVDNITVFSNEEVLKRLGITDNTGTYTGTWTKIGEVDGKIKLVSSRNVANCILGGNDPRATDSTVKDSLEAGARDIEIAKWSYKHLVETLDIVAQEETGINSAESIKIEDIYDIIGEENIDRGTNYGTLWNYYFYNGTVWSKYSTGVDDKRRYKMVYGV